MNQLAVSRPWGTGVNEPAPPGHQLPEVGVNEPILSGVISGSSYGLILLDEQRASAARGAIEFDRAQDLGSS